MIDNFCLKGNDGEAVCSGLSRIWAEGSGSPAGSAEPGADCLKVAIQGVAGCFHDEAARGWFGERGQETVTVGFDTFADLFEALQADSSMVAAVAIENTIAGSLLANHELLRASGLRIVGERKMRISHVLCALPGTRLEDVTEVHSHPMALMQCEKWLRQHPGMRMVEHSDTAGSAREIAEKGIRGRAAVCSRYAAELYDLDILAEGIETNKHNYTRFLILADPVVAEEMAKSEPAPDKASIVLTLPHANGALAKVLVTLANYGIGLSKIQSTPIVGREWEYRFYIDLTFSDAVRYQQALAAMMPLVSDFRLLGEYRDTPTPKPEAAAGRLAPAARISDVKEYYFSRKLKEIAALNAAGADIISLGIGGPDTPPPAPAIRGAVECLERPDTHGYQMTIGMPELRRAYARWYAREYDVVGIDPDKEVLPLVGSKEGVLNIAMAFVNPGDAVLVPNPGYPTYTSASRLAGAEVIHYDLRADRGWYPDFNALERLPLERVKIMWVTYPHMPTGAPATRDLFEQLVAFGRKHNILIVNDNPYSFIRNEHPLSIMQVPGAMETALEMNSLSKCLNLAGWRLGMLVGREDYISWVLRVKSNIDSGQPRAMMEGAIRALEAPAQWYRELNALYARRAVVARRIMEALGCAAEDGQQGLFMWGRIPAEAENAEAFADAILDRARVFVTPGSVFGSNGDRYIRISLCAPESVLERALERINKYM